MMGTIQLLTWRGHRSESNDYKFLLWNGTKIIVIM